MTSAGELLHQIDDPNLSLHERTRLRCQLAKQFEKAGNYEAACRALDNLWSGCGNPPNLDALDERTSAEVLLRVGVLTGQIGSCRLIKGSQKMAKDLIDESITIFESLRDVKKVAEGRIEIALCCMREGTPDIARALYAQALARLDDNDGDLKATAVLRSAILEVLANRLHDALSILSTAVELFEASNNHTLRGSFHNQLGIVLEKLGVSENRPDYIERVFSEYAAASFHFKQAGHARYQGSVENNLGMLCIQVGRFSEAHEHLDLAQALFTGEADSIDLARLEDTRARVLLAEGQAAKAEQASRTAVQMLERGDHELLLAEALTTHGTALALLSRRSEAREVLETAIDIAVHIDEFESAGLAALTLVEYLAEHLSIDELCFTLQRAHTWLKNTQSASSRRRLMECACRTLSIVHSFRPDWSSFSLDETLRRQEGRFIQMALEDAGGSVTRAAALLGLRGHQSLQSILNLRHQDLLGLRKPIRPRRRSIIHAA